VRKHGGLAAVGDLRRAQAARTALIAQSRAERERQARAYLAAPGVLDDATRAALGNFVEDAAIFKAIAGAYVSALSGTASKAQPATLHDVAERARRYAGFSAELDAYLAGKPQFAGKSAESIKAASPYRFSRFRKVRNAKWRPMSRCAGLPARNSSFTGIISRSALTCCIFICLNATET